MKKLLIAAAAALLACPAFAADFSADSREFVSSNKRYRLQVDYAAIGGGGPARFELKDKGGKKISVFESRRAPFSVSISGDGRRLFALNGVWSQQVAITDMNIYDRSGKVLARHDVRMIGPCGEDFSADFSVYALGADPGQGAIVYVFDSATGALRWKKHFKEKMNGLKLSGDGARLAVVLAAGKNSYRAVVFGADGAEEASVAVKTPNNLTPQRFSADGEELELWEGKMVYDEKVDYYRDTVVKKRRYTLSGGALEEASPAE
jgi:hypothetical protein